MSRKPACTPPAASSPKAEPPDSTRPSTDADRHRRIEQRRVPSARRTAEHGAGSDRRLIEDDGSDAGAQRKIGAMTDGDAFDIGQEIEEVSQ